MFFAVEVLSKPDYTPCSNRDSVGCTIYDSRPKACSAYACLWLEGELETAHRPDLVGIAFDVPTALSEDPDYAGVAVIRAWEVRPRAAKEVPADKLILGLAWRVLVQLTLWGGETKLVGPRKWVDLVGKRVEARLASEGGPGGVNPDPRGLPLA